MKAHSIRYIILVVNIAFLHSFVYATPKLCTQVISDSHREDNTVNLRMLPVMENISWENQKNIIVRKQQFQAVTTSGSSSHVPEANYNNQTFPGLQEGFTDRQTEKNLEMFCGEYMVVLINFSEESVSQKHYNQNMKNSSNASSCKRRAGITSRMDENNTAYTDDNRSNHYIPGNVKANSRKLLVLINTEGNTNEVSLSGTYSRTNIRRQNYWHFVLLYPGRESVKPNAEKISDSNCFYRQAHQYAKNAFLNRTIIKTSKFRQPGKVKSPGYLFSTGIYNFKVRFKEPIIQHATEPERLNGEKSYLSEIAI